MKEGVEAGRDRDESDFALVTYQSSLGPAHFSLFINFSCQYSLSEQTLQEQRQTALGGGGGADRMAKVYFKHCV